MSDDSLSSFDPHIMALRGRIGAYRLHATHDPRETTANARAAFLSKFEKDVDPDETLPPEERQRRAAAARKAHFARLALKSGQKRRERKTNGHARSGADTAPTPRHDAELGDAR